MVQPNKKRAAIYFFYDADGVVDRYVEYFLNELRKTVDKLVIVVNGKLTPVGWDIFSSLTEDLIVRENKGFDAWAYKVGLEYIGWIELRGYYEVLLLNSTIMGPVFPFKEMFDEMDKDEKLDFWGITKHKKLDLDCDPLIVSSFGYIPEHIQSFFIVYRNKFLKTGDLKDYWSNLPEINSVDESISKYETCFTKYFEDKGFRWKAYVDQSDGIDADTDYILFSNPVRAIDRYRCPVFKRRIFFNNRDRFLQNSIGNQVYELIEYLKEQTSYDVDMIYENIIRTCDQHNFLMNMNHIYILSSVSEYTTPSKSKSALLMYVYFEDLLEDSLRYAKSAPEEMDIYVVTGNENLKISTIEEMFRSQLKNRVEVRTKKNRGRDVSALLVTLSDVVDKYDYCCFFHDKKSAHHGADIENGRNFAVKIHQSVLYNRVYVRNIIATFDKNERLGMLSPLEPNHGVLNDVLGGEWGDNYENTKKLAERFEIKVKMSEEKPPIAPLGGVFWFRSKALKKLFDYGWKYNDFPPESQIGFDGSISHALERFYPYVAQDAGYYPGYVMPERLASNELINTRHYLRKYNVLARKNDIFGSNLGKAQRMESMLAQNKELERQISILIPQTSLKTQIRLRIKRILPKWLYSAIVRIKRFLFGPRNVGYSYDENPWESDLGQK